MPVDNHIIRWASLDSWFGLGNTSVFCFVLKVYLRDRDRKSERWEGAEGRERESSRRLLAEHRARHKSPSQKPEIMT